MDRGVVKKEIYFFVSASASHLLQEVNELGSIEAKFLNGKCEQLVTCAYCCTDSLARLVVSAVFYDNVGVRR